MAAKKAKDEAVRPDVAPVAEQPGPAVGFAQAPGGGWIAYATQGGAWEVLTPARNVRNDKGALELRRAESRTMAIARAQTALKDLVTRRKP